MAALSIAVIGCGTAAWVGHLPWIWAHPQASLTAVCDASLERAVAAKNRYGAHVAVTDFRCLLDRGDVDAVIICTPPSTHLPIATAAARAGKHVLLEKPMGRSVAECDEIIESSRDAGVCLMLGHEKRFNSACKAVREIIESGVIGEVFHLSVQWGASVKLDPERLIPDGYQSGYEWRWKDPSVGGGILQDHLPHYVDLWRCWTRSEVETVCAEMLHVSRDYLGRPDIGLWEDYGSVLLRFTNGAIATFDTGTVGRGLSPILHAGSGIGEWSEFGHIFGTRGQIVFDLPPWDSPENGRVMVWSLEQKAPAHRGWYQVEMPEPQRSPGGPLSPVTNTEYMFYRQLDAFLQAVLRGERPAVSGEDGRATVEVIEAAYESQRTSAIVPLQHARTFREQMERSA